MTDKEKPSVAEEPPTGVLLLDKPVGPTSFRMVQLVRRAVAVRKVGHAGTLDPFASGLLVVAVGRAATRLIPRLMAGDKVYTATIRLGIETDTLDHTGAIIAEKVVAPLTAAEVEAVLARFLGDQLQQPPLYSALKFRGRPLYYYARRGFPVTKEARPVTIRELQLLNLAPDQMTVRICCSKGTYIRTLAGDIGAALGCGAHLTCLRRDRSGPFSVEDALAGEDLTADKQASISARTRLLAIDDVLARLGAVAIAGGENGVESEDQGPYGSERVTN